MSTTSSATARAGSETSARRRLSRIPRPRVLVRWLRSWPDFRGPRLRRDWIIERGAERLLAASAVALLMLSLLLAQAPLALAQAPLLLAGALLIAALLVPARHAGAQPAAFGSPGLSQATQRLERRIEQLEDLNWKIFENEARYRNLLDSQADMILRRDAEGRLTFVNRAFCQVFGVEAASVQGKIFEPVQLAQEAPCMDGAQPLVGRRRRCELIATSAGPRWIEWEEHPVSGADGFGDEVQCVGRDVSEERRAAAELAVARDQAEAASRAKSRFLATMSHEIRTPMNGILGMAALLADTQQTPEQATYTNAINQSARILLVIIDEILDFSKIEAGKLVLAAQPFSIEATLQAAVELLAPSAEEKGLEIAWSIGRGMPQLVLGDESRVRQILLNLVSNAVKFTDTGGILITARVDADAALVPGETRIVIAVQDTGIGLSEEEQQTLFCEFEQADAAIRRQHGGTGLGLAISQRIARAMGGTIAVTSTPGKGALFSLALTLPLPQAGPNQTERPYTPPPGPVLLALDRPLERQALQDLLEAHGIETIARSSDSAPSAVSESAAKGRPVSYVLVGGEMSPDCAGRLLLEAKRAAAAQDARGLVLVNLLSRADLSAFRAAGFDAYLVRPVRPASLLERLSAAPQVPGSDPARPSAATSATRQPDDDAGRPRPRVLLAEDNDINALLATRVLEKAGCHVTAVRSGVEAILAMEGVLSGNEKAFGLILMDIFMPVLDGLEAMRRIREMFAAQSQSTACCPPIVALTANAFAEDRQRYLEAGMDDYLAKPFDIPQITALLVRWLPAGPLATDNREKAGRPAA